MNYAKPTMDKGVKQVIQNFLDVFPLPHKHQNLINHHDLSYEWRDSIQQQHQITEVVYAKVDLKDCITENLKCVEDRKGNLPRANAITARPEPQLLKNESLEKEEIFLFIKKVFSVKKSHLEPTTQKRFVLLILGFS